MISYGRSGEPGELYANHVLAPNAVIALKDAGVRLITITGGKERDENGGAELMK